MEPAIRVENLGKLYRVTGSGERANYATLRESLTHAAGAPLRWARKGFAPPDPAEDFWALKGVDFEVQPGEVVGIIGRNGAGKSTLLKILSRITKPTTGRVTLNGRVGSLLEVGTGFHPELTGRENVYLNGSILGMSRREIAKKFDEIVAFAEVERFLDTPVKRYSSGMYVRLAFAVAAHLEPEILIVDEVLAVGDVGFQKKCLGKIREIGSSGRTVLFVSHNTDVVLALCSRCVVLRHGKVIGDGTPHNTVTLHLSDAMDQSDGTFDLASHPARNKSQPAIMTELTLRSPHGVSSVFVTNDPLHADLTIATGRTISQAKVALAVEDAFGRRLFTVASYFTRPGFEELDGIQVVRCTIPRLRLGAGKYLVSVSVSDPYHGMLDSLDAAGWFQVESHDPYGTGELYSPVYGPVIEDSRWQLV